MQSVTILGATGSIGVNTLDVLARHPGRYAIFALTANNNIELLIDQARRFRPRYVVVGAAERVEEVHGALRDGGLDTEVLNGVSGLETVAGHPEVDTVMAAIVGGIGLVPTLAAVRAGKKVLLANKEPLVMAGPLFMDAVARSGARLLPIDSEHNAIFQCLPAHYAGDAAREGVRKILLTGSGGPFRCTPLTELGAVTPDQACDHPNWSMGRKISVDSATMMNKGLEFIEACWLFHAPPERIEVVIHPQSVVHSMVEYVDGSVLAQLGNPDMRTPIAHALAWPERIESGVTSLDLVAQARLDFEAPDEQRFPCLRLAREAVAAGGSAAAVLNAANEVAVAAFLAESIPFTQIPVIIEEVMAESTYTEPTDLGAVQQADAEARERARRLVLARSAA